MIAPTKLYLMITSTADNTAVQHFTSPEDRTSAFRAFCAGRWDAAAHGPMPHDPWTAHDRVSDSKNFVTLSEIDLATHPHVAKLTGLLQEIISQGADCDGDVILTLDRPSDLRSRIHTALDRPWRRHQLFHGWRDVDRDTNDDPIVWRNHYHCTACDEHWEDQWSSQCDDTCPCCGAAISPEESTWIGPEEPAASDLWSAAAA